MKEEIIKIIEEYFTTRKHFKEFEFFIKGEKFMTANSITYKGKDDNSFYFVTEDKKPVMEFQIDSIENFYIQADLDVIIVFNNNLNLIIK